MIPTLVSLAALGRLESRRNGRQECLRYGFGGARGWPSVAERSAGWETRDTADWEVCGTREKPVRVHRRREPGTSSQHPQFLAVSAPGGRSRF